MGKDMAESAGKLRIKLKTGADLDGGGGSDPYCVFVLGDEEVKSKVVHGSSEPNWEDEFHMPVPDDRYYLRVLLYDRDEGSELEDDFLGYAEVCLSDLAEDEDTPLALKLQKATSGVINVELTKDMQPNNPDDDKGYDEEGDMDDDDDFPAVVAAKPPAKLGSMATKAWEGQFKPPSSENGKKKRDKDSAATSMDLTLEHVHGFRGHDTRQALFYNSAGKVVWFTAAVGIVYDKETNQQRFFMGEGAHDDDILCMAMHPDGTTVATGQIGKEPKICVWDSDDCQMKSELVGKHQRGISAVAFSQSGNKLGSIGMDDQNSVIVWDWKKGKPLGAPAKGGPNKLLMITFDAANDSNFFTVGAKHCKFWSVSPGGKLAGKNGAFGKKFKQQTLLVTAAHRGGYLSGCYDGKIYTWIGGSCVNQIKAHDGPTYAIYSCEHGVVSGGKDGAVILYDISLKEQAKWNIAGESIRSVFLSKDGLILAGTFEGSIYEINSKTKDAPPVVINLGHGGMKEANNKYSGELWGLSMHPSGKMYATCGDDRLLRVFDITGRKCLAATDVGVLDCRARACCWHPDGHRIAVAQKDGKVRILEFDGKSSVAEKAVLPQMRTFKNLEQGGIDELRFNPKGDLLATGAHSEGKGGHGGMIDIFNTSDADPSKWKQANKLQGHTSFVTHLDWDVDGKIIKSTDGNPELLYWDATGGSGNVKGGASTFADVEWATYSTICGWPVQGIFRKLPGQVKQMDMTDVNMVDVSSDKKVIALGDDYGQVALYSYPCTRTGDKGKYFGGHSSHVPNVKFTGDSEYLISVGGHDLAVFQLKCSQ